MKNNVRGFGLVAISIHWVTALTVIGLFILGYWMTGLDYYHAWYNRAPAIHKSIGILLLLLLIIRLMWQLLNPKPRELKSWSSLEKKASRLTHPALIALSFVVIASGYLITTANGQPLDVFGWFTVPAYPTGIDNQEDIAGTIHWYLSCVLIGWSLIHALGALKHHFLNKDETLKRMLNPNL